MKIYYNDAWQEYYAEESSLELDIHRVAYGKTREEAIRKFKEKYGEPSPFFMYELMRK